MAKKKVKPIPSGYEGVTPYLAVAGGAAAIEFYKKAFGATKHECMDGPGGKIMHAEIRIGKARVMLADESPENDFKSPTSYGGSPVNLLVYCEDVDALFARAVAAGATVKRPVEDQFYGDRTGTLVDPFGHLWSFATRKEDLTPEETSKRAAALFGGS